MTQLKKYAKYTSLILTFVWIGVIFSFSLQNGSLSSLQSGFFSTRIHQFLLSMGMNISKSTVSFIIRKGAHFTEFFILGCLSAKSTLDLNSRRYLPLIFLVPIMDEFIQSFVPDRAMSIYDMGIDASGIILGLLFVKLLTSFLTKKAKL